MNFLYINDHKGPFGSKTIDSNSFSRIAQIINEINKMSQATETDPTSVTFSFIEVLDDTKFQYLCSIRSFMIGGIVYFLMFVDDINSYMINPSYRKTLTNIFDSLSGTHRFVNYLSLVIQIPEISIMVVYAIPAEKIQLFCWFSTMHFLSPEITRVCIFTFNFS